MNNLKPICILAMGFTMSLTMTAPSLLLAQAAPAAATGATAQMLAEAKGALDNLKYAEALRIGREILQNSRLRPPLMMQTYHVMAAAFFPEEGQGADTDSAVFYLRRAIRLVPDAPLSSDVRWRGLDSLFAATRATTFAAIARPPADNALTGIDGRAFVEVISTRPAHMTLSAVGARSGMVSVHDSVTGVTRARLGLRAHDGVKPLFTSGDYEIRAIVTDVTTGQTDTLRFGATAIGAPPVLDAVPTPDSSGLKPERAPKAFAKGIATGILVGASTIAVSRYARAGKPVRDTFRADGRASFIAVLIAAGSIAGGIMDRGKPLPENVAANTILRADQQKRLTGILDANRRRVSEYRVELRIDQEAR